MKSINTKNLKDGVYFVPLGGCGEIGRNLNLFGSIKDGKESWIIVDIGISISKSVTRLECPKFEFALEKDIDGIVCTHGHDDHIGGLSIILPRLEEAMKSRNPHHKRIPVYATPFTMGLIKRKLEEARIGMKFHFVNNKDFSYLKYLRTVVNKPDSIMIANLQIVEPSSSFIVGDFEIELIYITHSILEPNMIKIRSISHNYSILHTGDWKFDYDPVLGEITDQDAIRKIGDKGIDVLVCDSTNALEDTQTPPEGLVKESLRKMIKNTNNKRIVISCFSSNVARLKIIHDLCKDFNKHFVGAGASILKMWQVAKESGYLDDSHEMYVLDDLHKLDHTKVILVCTGSQAEKGSVLHRLAYSNKPPFNLLKGDIVVFSSRKIPGNEKEIGDMQSELVNRGVTIWDTKNHPGIHVSGHPSRPEVQKMIELVRPKSFIPVHGTSLHFYYMLQLAEDMGIKKTLMPKNGHVIDLKETKAIGTVISGVMGVDGKQLVDIESRMIEVRGQLRDNGIINIALKPGKKPICVSNYGCLPDDVFKDNFSRIVKIIMEQTNNYDSSEKKQVIKNIIAFVSGFIKQNFDKNPIISVQILVDHYTGN